METLSPLRKGDPLRIEGALFGGVFCGIKEKGFDLGGILFPDGAHVSALRTENTFRSPSLSPWEEKELERSLSYLLLVNSGNANALTGKEGVKAVKEILKEGNETLRRYHYLPSRKKGGVLLASTGVIGEPLPVEKIKSGIGILFQKFSPDGLWDFASAITTTDRFPKVAEVEVSGKIGGKVVGIGKGAGMISPSLATMLVFLITDLGPPRRILRSSLKRAVEDTVGAIVVDGDQSTNDLVALFATGKRNPPWAKGMEEPFFHAVHEVLLQIGKQIVQDGEGATKLVEIVVEGGSRNHISRKVAQMIATSLLVKTALYGEDPNWGRIAARVGSCGLPLREEDLEIYFGEIPLFKKGKPPSEEILKEARHYLKRSEITVRVRFPGKGKARVFTCDIGVPYVELNAHYRT